MTRKQYTPDLEIALSRRRTQLESRLMDRDKEKRQEYLTCWKDLAYLSKGLLVVLKDYWDFSLKASFGGLRLKLIVMDDRAFLIL